MKIESYTVAFKKPRSGRLRNVSITVPVNEGEDGAIVASRKIKASHIGQELLRQGYNEYGISNGRLVYSKRRKRKLVKVALTT